ncbi:hypothetical protein Tco_0117193 [Tanacetum coccineum]
MLLGDLNIIWETTESSDDDFWKDQEEWEIIRWRFHESSGVHTLEIEDGTMIHMLAERRYPLSRELMIRMLEHGMEVEDESETAITLIHLFILWTTANGKTRFKDLLTSDMKEILLQRMLEENYDKGHEDHKMAYEALQKFILCDESEQFDADKAEKPKKMKRKQDSPKTPPGSPPPPPPPLPPSGPSGASGTTGASDSAQDPIPAPSSTTTNQWIHLKAHMLQARPRQLLQQHIQPGQRQPPDSSPLPHLFLKMYLCIKSQTLKLRI